MRGSSSLETTAALMSARLDDLKFAVECVDLGRDVENAGVSLVIVSDLSCQPPIVGAAGQVQGLVIGRRLPGNGIDKPHGEWLGGRVANVRGGGE